MSEQPEKPSDLIALVRDKLCLLQDPSAAAQDERGFDIDAALSALATLESEFSRAESQLEADRVALSLWRADVKTAEARIDALRSGLEVIRKHSPSAASRCDADLILEADDELALAKAQAVK